MVSIEPIMDFDLEVLLAWLREISPRFVSVGYDNHNKGLLEPSLEKTRSLISALSQFTEVRAKTLREAFWREKEGTFFGKGEADIEGTFLSG